MKNIMRLVAIVFVLGAFAWRVSAQVDTGAIIGNVRDSTGAAVPGVTVTAVSEGTGISHPAVTDSAGEYDLSPLPLGYYTLTFARNGFKTSVQRHMEVTIQAQLKVNVTLQVGAVSQSVQVRLFGYAVAGYPDVFYAATGRITPINNLPLNRRNATFLAQLAPGVNFHPARYARSARPAAPLAPTALGRTENDYLLDGLDNYSYIGDLVNQTQYALTARLTRCAITVADRATTRLIRPLCRSHSEYLHQVRNQPFTWRSVGVPAQRRLRCRGLLCHHRQAGVPLQPVRWYVRRAH